MARIVRIHQTGGPDVLRLDEIDPAPPGPGEIALQVKALAAEQAPFPLFAVLGKMLSVHGYQYKRVVGDPAKLDAAKRFVLDGLASGALKPAIDRVFPLDRIADAHRYLESNEQFGKIVVTV